MACRRRSGARTFSAKTSSKCEGVMPSRRDPERAPALFIRMSMWGPKAEVVAEMISDAEEGWGRSVWMEIPRLGEAVVWIRERRVVMLGVEVAEV